MKMDEPDILEVMVLADGWCIHPLANMSRPHPQFGEGVTVHTPLELSQLILKWAQSHDVVTA